MDGRWTLWLDADMGHVRGVRGSYLFGPYDQKLVAVPAVPCDDAAIERAADDLAEASHRVMPHNWYRMRAESMFRAAGETT